MYVGASLSLTDISHRRELLSGKRPSETLAPERLQTMEQSAQAKTILVNE